MSFIYGTPEALTKDETKAAVNSFKYDVYILGILAIELFTKERERKTTKVSNPDSKGAEVMYDRILDIVKEKEF